MCILHYVLDFFFGETSWFLNAIANKKEMERIVAKTCESIFEKENMTQTPHHVPVPYIILKDL